MQNYCGHAIEDCGQSSRCVGMVQRQLHLLDDPERVEFKQYPASMRGSFRSVFEEGAKHAIVLEGANVAIPTALGIPLGFIVNELITNRRNTPRAPSPFGWEGVEGLGMKIVQCLVRQIGGELHIAHASS